MGRKSIPKLKKTLQPGQVVIILSGPFAGKRCIFLKQLEGSGLLLVTGPFKLNGVPLRRMCQTRVIATSTKVDVSGADVSKIDDKVFLMTKSDKARSKQEREDYLQQGTIPAKKVSSERKALQDTVDGALIEGINKDRMMKQYLRATFSLTGRPAPHLLKW